MLILLTVTPITYCCLYAQGNLYNAIAHTGMAILEVGILSGFGLLPGAEIQADFIRKVDREPQRVSLYLDSVSAEVIFFIC
ncbi:hypothetical protein XENORESO_009394 [Xenotaenia resolanae]|uniref:Alpha-macroglobulin receptor-binding domain-containing protein n=1 Tax=Xenotaenia resolanae TaxID=208358 RepID=A0ABV0WDQ2_9TELE